MDPGFSSYPAFPQGTGLLTPSTSSSSFTHLLPGSHRHRVFWRSLPLWHATGGRKSCLEGAELLQLPATQMQTASCSCEEKSGIVVVGVQGRWRRGGGTARLGIAEQGEVMGHLQASVRQVLVIPVSHQLASGQQRSWTF